MRILLLIVGSVLIVDTLLVALVSNPNLGVFLPALLGLPPVLVGLFYPHLIPWMRCGLGLWVKRALIGGYALFFAGFIVVCALIVHSAVSAPDPGAQAVIVLGGGLRDNRPSLTLAKRLNCAREYLESNPDTLVVVSGGLGRGEEVTEAQAMAEYLMERGIEPSRILQEGASTSTQENLTYSKALLDPLFPQGYRVVVVSSDFHLFRAKLVADKVGLNAQGLGRGSSWYLCPNFYLREYVAIVAYFLLGRL